MTFADGCLFAFLIGIAFAAGLMLRRSPEPIAPVNNLITGVKGNVFVLETTRQLTVKQYDQLRAYLDQQESHASVKFIVLDSLRVVAIKSSE